MEKLPCNYCGRKSYAGDISCSMCRTEAEREQYYLEKMEDIEGDLYGDEENETED